MAAHFRMSRGRGSAATPLVVTSLLLAAALLVGVGQIKHASIERGYRHTQYAAASVVSVGANRIAKVRYLWGGAARTGQLDVTATSGVDRGDHLALRVSDGGHRLQLQTPFYGAVYPWTAVTLMLVALFVAMSSRRSQAAFSRHKPWLPAELRRPRRRHRVGHA
jgi:hypothetical protein